jgi:hypothetical protein
MLEEVTITVASLKSVVRRNGNGRSAARSAAKARSRAALRSPMRSSVKP